MLIFQESKGEIFSPNYPKPDTGNERFCQWRISATHGEKVILNITHMNIELTRNCYTNYLEVRDGHYHRWVGCGFLPTTHFVELNFCLFIRINVTMNLNGK